MRSTSVLIRKLRPEEEQFPPRSCGYFLAGLGCGPGLPDEVVFPFKVVSTPGYRRLLHDDKR